MRPRAPGPEYPMVLSLRKLQTLLYVLIKFEKLISRTYSITGLNVFLFFFSFSCTFTIQPIPLLSSKFGENQVHPEWVLNVARNCCSSW